MAAIFAVWNVKDLTANIPKSKQFLFDVWHYELIQKVANYTMYKMYNIHFSNTKAPLERAQFLLLLVKKNWALEWLKECFIASLFDM